MIVKTAIFLSLTYGLEFLSRRSLQVPFQVCVICESHVTLNTLVRLLSSVNSHVNLKVSFICEVLPTQLAGVRLLSSVNSHLEFKVSSFCFLSRRVSKRFFPSHGILTYVILIFSSISFSS